MRLLLTLSILLFASPILAEQLNLPKDAEGWTIFTPSSDSRIMYISEEGDDATGQVYAHDSFADPFKPTGEQAFATYAAAYAHIREGEADWVLFKRGDVFYDYLDRNVRNGKSSTEPHLIAAYGDTGTMPILKTGANSGLEKRTDPSYIAVSGIDFYAHTRNPNDPEYIGPDGGVAFAFIVFGGDNPGGGGILVEGCKFRFYAGNSADDVSGIQAHFSGITIRRNVFLDNYKDGSHCQGLWLGNVDDIVLEENIFDHNGWFSMDGPGYPTIFNHNTYAKGLSNAVFRNNIFMRGSSIGNKFTANDGLHSTDGVTISNNLYVGNQIGISMGGNEDGAYRFHDISITENVFVHQGVGGWTGQNIAWGIDMLDWENGLVQRNYILHNENQNISAHQEHGISMINSFRDVNVTHNIMYNHGGIEQDNSNGNLSLINTTVSDNQIDAIDHPDPTRDIDTYMTSIGETPTLEAFYTAARSMDRYNWDTRFTAPVVNSWIKAGFNYTPEAVLRIIEIYEE